MSQYSDEQIDHILKVYKSHREKDKAIYQKRKEDPAFMQSNRDRANAYYHDNKEKRKEHYENNKVLHQAKCSFHYYQRKNDVKKFQEKYPERCELLLQNNYFKDQNPFASTETSD
tara:strand:- start:19182 stop:19526 length:345 start_codon:yes stop_codon:yes gene_type:complete